MWINIQTSKLFAADWNYKEDINPIIQSKMDKLEANISENGFVENMIVRELSNNKFEVINGNHRLIIARKLGIKKIHCFNFGKISINKAKLIAVQTNESKFEANPIRLAETIIEIGKDFDNIINTVFFDESHFESFEKIVNPEFYSNEDLPKDDSKPENDEFRTIKLRLPCDVANQFDEQVKRFKNLLYPNDDSKNVSYIMPIEAMIQALHQIDNNNII